MLTGAVATEGRVEERAGASGDFGAPPGGESRRIRGAGKRNAVPGERG